MVVFYATRKRAQIARRADERFAMYSTFKFLAAALLKRAGEDTVPLEQRARPG